MLGLKGSPGNGSPLPPHTPKAVTLLEDRPHLTSSQLLIPRDFADTIAVSKNASPHTYPHSFASPSRPKDTRGTASLCVPACRAAGRRASGCEGSRAGNAPTPRHPPPAPLAARRCRGLWHPRVPAWELPPCPSAPPTCVCPGPEPAPAAGGGRPADSTHATGSCPPPAR